MLIKAEPTIPRQIQWHMFGFVLPAVCLFGVFTNLINIIVLSNSKLKENVYVYMLAYSVSDFFYTFFVFFSWVSRSQLPLATTYIAKWYEIYVFFTALNGLGTMSGLIEIAISFDRLFLVKKTCLFSRKISPKVMIALMFIISALTATVYCLPRSIKEIETEYYNPEKNVTYTEKAFIIYFNSFGTSLDGRVLYVVVTVIKNIGTILIMIIVNTFLVIEMGKYYKKKSNLLKKNQPKNVTSITEDKLSRTDSQVEVKIPSNRPKETSEERSHMHRFIKMVIIQIIINKLFKLEICLLKRLLVCSCCT